MTAVRAEAPRSPFANMRFRVEIDGMAGTGALEVIFPEARIVAQPPKPGAVRYGALIVKRGLTTARDWYEWWDAARSARRPPKRPVRILLLDEAGIETGGWRFEETTPVAYQLSPLNALGNEPVIETLELAVGRFEALAPQALADGGRGAT